MSDKKTMRDILNDPWFKSRPPAVQAAICKYPPGLYWLPDPGQNVLIRSYIENADGTCTKCTVNVLFEHNPQLLFERTVFDVELAELEPIDVLE